MQREIGSEFHSIEFNNECERNVFEYLKEYNTAFFDSGRSALKSLLTMISHQRVLLPGYICESVRECFCGSEVNYYKVDTELCICWDDLISKIHQGIDIVYLHFFNGYIDKSYDFKKLKELQTLFGFLIVEDTTHSFLTDKNLIGDYCICSLRKWFAIPDGGVLYSFKALKQCGTTLKNDWSQRKLAAMKEKARYLSDGTANKEQYLSAFNRCEAALDNQIVSFDMSDESKEILMNICVKEVSAIRKHNKSYLDKLLPDSIKRIALGSNGQVPLFFTVSLLDRDAIRKKLIEHKIYCPVHWPLYSELERMSEAKVINAQELSIPIDQRYDDSDMEHIAHVLLLSEVGI